jgi:uncharacterized membrane protein YgcG
MRSTGQRAFLVALLLAAVALAPPPVAATDYPTLQHWVNDQVGVINQSDGDDLEVICVDVNREKGVEMVVLIVNTTQPDGIDLYALRTFERNQLGQAGRDNGLLIVISVGESQWRIEVGSGLEAVLPDSLVSSIASDHLVPYLNQGDYFDGLLYTMVELGQEIMDHYDVKPSSGGGSHHPISWLPCTTWELVLLALLIALVVGTKGRIISWLPSRFMKRGGSGEGKGSSKGGGRSKGRGRSGGEGVSRKR